jgi:hypothetical protein
MQRIASPRPSPTLLSTLQRIAASLAGELIVRMQYVTVRYGREKVRRRIQIRRLNLKAPRPVEAGVRDDVPVRVSESEEIKHFRSIGLYIRRDELKEAVIL